MVATRTIRTIIKRDGSAVRYNRERIYNAILQAMTSVGRGSPRQADAMAAKVEQALAQTYAGEAVPSVEDIQDVVETVLMENGFTEVARAYIIYRHRRAMARARKAYSFEVTDHVPYRVIYDVLRWNMEHQCDTPDGLNRIVRQGRLPELIRASDRRYDDEVRRAANRILDDDAKVRIVIIAGPSSSGKTTTTIKLGEHLARAGLSLKAINIDNYFFDLVQHPRDEFGDYDYETPDALDLELIDRHLVELLDGRAVKTPHYDFKTGKRSLGVHALRLRRNEILLIDSLHGLYEGMTRSVPPEAKFRVYIETLGQFRSDDGNFMRWADARLLRRMQRDKDHRNLKPIQTLTHWHYVRRSELRHIIPFIKDADVLVNSALPYELPFFRARLFACIARVRNRYRDEPRRLDAHIRANRVYDLLKPIKPVRDDAPVPDDSLLREFIGGSRYRY